MALQKFRIDIECHSSHDRARWCRAELGKKWRDQLAVDHNREIRVNTSTRQTNIRIRIYKDFHVHVREKGRETEDENALKDDNSGTRYFVGGCQSIQKKRNYLSINSKAQHEEYYLECVLKSYWGTSTSFPSLRLRRIYSESIIKRNEEKIAFHVTCSLSCQSMASGWSKLYCETFAFCSVVRFL